MNVNKVIIGALPVNGELSSIDLKTAIDTSEKAYCNYSFQEFDTPPNCGNGFSAFLFK